MTSDRFALSTTQVANLEKMLPRTRRAIDLPDLARRLEEIGDRYQRVMGRLDCLPTQEIWDRCAANVAYAGKVTTKLNQLSRRGEVMLSNRTIKADRELMRLCEDLAKEWKRATGRQLSGWSVSEAEETKAHRAAVATKHPLGMMLDALGVYVAVSSVDTLARCGRRLLTTPQETA